MALAGFALDGFCESRCSFRVSCTITGTWRYIRRMTATVSNRLGFGTDDAKSRVVGRTRKCISRLLGAIGNRGNKQVHRDSFPFIYQA